MKKYLLIGLATALTSCWPYTKVHNLTLYNQFQLTKNEIRIDGYFHRQDSSGQKSIVRPIYFFTDGTLGIYSQFGTEDNNHLEDFIKLRHRYILPDWGAYKISNDSIKIQILGQVGNSPIRHEDVILWEGIILNDTTFVIKSETIPWEYIGKKKKTEIKNQVFRFQKSNVKLDSTANWTKKKLMK